MARQMELKGRTFFILSEPHGGGWKATVVEMKDGSKSDLGIVATAETQTAADDAAERELRRKLQAY